MRKTMLALLFMGLCACAPRVAVMPNSPGEIAASYSAELRVYTAVADQSFKTRAITADVAQQVADALSAANSSLRLYYAMSECKNVQAAAAKLAPGNAALMIGSVAAVCDQFNGKPLDELAQLKLAQAALAALSQKLAGAK